MVTNSASSMPVTKVEAIPTRVFYIRTQDKNRFPVACVAYRTYPGLGTTYAVSVYNPKDPFDKALGRSIAIGRLDKSNDIGVVGKVHTDDKMYVEHDILQSITQMQAIPAKIRDLALAEFAIDSAGPLF